MKWQTTGNVLKISFKKCGQPHFFITKGAKKIILFVNNKENEKWQIYQNRKGRNLLLR